MGAGFHLAISAWSCGPEGGNAFSFTGFATLGLVLELLIVEKQLFSRGKNEVGPAVNALQYLVLEFHGECSLQSVTPKHTNGVNHPNQ
jgi:hypothetical protein